jgi:anti-anti-sigma factor
MLDITTVPIGRIAVIDLCGRIDAMNAGLLSDAIARASENQRAGIILDMAKVDYMSAAGLRVLRALYDKTGVVHVAEPSGRVREVLQMTGLSAQYKVYETRVEAIHAIAPITNAHTHLELGWLADYRPGVSGAPFVDWILGLIDRRRALGTREEVIAKKAIDAAIQTLLEAGTTTVGDISSVGWSIEPLLASGMKGIVYLEVLGVNLERGEETLQRARTLIDEWRPKERNGLRLGISLHAPYSVHPALWKSALDYVRKEALPLCIHTAESPAEADYLLNGTGAMIEYQTKLGIELPSPRITPIRYLEDLGALALKPLLVHAVQVSDDDIRRIKANGCSVVHCPRSNLRLRCGRMPLEKYLEQGVPVYLGTDSLCSAPSLDIFDELEVAAALHHGIVAPYKLAGMVHQAL